MQKFFYAFFAFILLLALGVTLWMFFGTPKKEASLSGSVSGNLFGEAVDTFMSRFVGAGFTQPQATSTLSERFFDTSLPLRKIWDKPVAGSQFVEYQYLLDATSTTASGTAIVRQERATSTLLMFVERATGYVYSYDIRSGALYQITNTLIPGIYDAYIFSNGTSAVLRYFDKENEVIRGIFVTIPRVAPGRDPVSLEEQLPLPNNITSLSLSPQGTSLSYLVPNETSSSLYVMSPDGNTSRRDIALTEWKVFNRGVTQLAVSKPSAYTMGSVLDVTTGVRTLSNRAGLMIEPSPNTTLYLANTWSRAGLSSFFFNAKTGAISQLPFKTLAEKCAWNAASTYVMCGAPKTLEVDSQGLPDDWYQGRVQFSDTLFVVRASDAAVEFSFDIESEAGETIDLITPQTSRDGLYLSFKNKRDGSLWFSDLVLMEQLED